MISSLIQSILQRGSSLLELPTVRRGGACGSQCEDCERISSPMRELRRTTQLGAKRLLNSNRFRPLTMQLVSSAKFEKW
jgi:hypothetical protein